MQIKIDWTENKVSAKGTEYMKITATIGEQKYDDVAVFKTYSKYGEVAPGATVEGIIEEKNDPKFGKSYTLIDEKTGGARGSGIKAAQERKAEFIDKTIGRKENGVTLSATFRDATLITLAQLTGQTFTDEEFKEKWQEWRLWLLNNFGDMGDVTQTKQPF